ncbi:hypothetical protein CVIRNUC_007003 [Coccomyxa viridis]|uniref:rRNA methylase n=1 Tax=Coccomyxa viridis TaxID=1274662 RepID=A0AAV1I9B6_9CHLO|nr:hypothetical protein CVIRNUC_007003 [Coccomyxa viridis]
MLYGRLAAGRTAAYRSQIQAWTSRCSEGLFGPRRCHRRNAGVHTRCASQLDSRTAEVHKDEAEVQSSVQALSQMQPIMQQGRKMTAVAQAAWAGFVRTGDVVVDATCGNGLDSLWLARAVGRSGKLYAFDIQADAVSTTRHLLHEHSSEHPDDAQDFEVVQACHSNLKEHVREPPQLVCFNLGFLPGGDRDIITRPGTSVAAVQAALDIVRPDGLVSVLAYTGHPGGREEYEAVRALGTRQDPARLTVFEQCIANRPTAPVLLLFLKRSPGQ